MSAGFLRYVRPDENHARTAAISGTSAQTGYPATQAVADDPGFPWWASSGTGSVTATFAAAEVGVVALIHPNADDGLSITISGSVVDTLTSVMGPDGWPQNLASIQDPSVTASSVTVTVAGNSTNVALGQLVIGKLREAPFPLEPGATRSFERQVFTDPDDTFKHTIRYDLGTELWSAHGRMFADDAALAEMLAWWKSTKGGSLPTLVIPSNVDTQPRLVRLRVVFTHTNDGAHQHRIEWALEEIQRGILVV